MNKTELVKIAANEAGVSQKEAEAVIKAAFDAVTKAMAEGDKVQLIGFGTFSFAAGAKMAAAGRTVKTYRLRLVKSVRYVVR